MKSQLIDHEQAINQQQLWRMLKILGGLVLLGLSLQFIVKNALPHLLSSQHRAALYGDVNGALLLHIGAGIPALLIGPLQFWPKFRNRFLQVHRYCGRVYVLAVFVASLGALYMSVFASNSLSAKSGLSARAGLGTLAVFWLISVVLAYVSIRRMNIREHQEWIIRSYIMTLVFVSHRLLTGWTMGLGFSFPEAFAAISWLCWVPALFGAEIIFSMKRLRGKEKDEGRKVMGEGRLENCEG
jgi:uncharacterized membrane protein